MDNGTPVVPDMVLTGDMLESARQEAPPGSNPEEFGKYMQMAGCPIVKAIWILDACGIPKGFIEDMYPNASFYLEERPKVMAIMKNLAEHYEKWVLKLKSYEGPNAYARLLPLALLAQEELLRNPKVAPATKLKVASEIVDRVHGKPKQTLETKSVSVNVSMDKRKENADMARRRIASLEAQRDKILAAKRAMPVRDADEKPPKGATLMEGL